jgi:hypothetical protein
MSKRMVSTTLAFVLMIAAPFAVAQESKNTEAAAKAPRLTIVEPVKDFGTVPKGQKIDWSFEINNSGTSDLEIIAARPTCGCTVADFDKIIKPGSTGKVTAHVDTTAFSGPISKAVTLETNDPSAPSAQITITAVVKPFVEAYPAGYVRYNLVQGEASKQSLLLYSEEAEPFEIVKIESPQEWIKVDHYEAKGTDIRPVGRKDQKQHVVDVTLGGPDTRVGPLAEKIHIITNSKNQPDYWISVSGVVRPPFNVEPKMVNFGEVDPGATRPLTLRSNSIKHPEGFVVTKAESGVPGITANVKQSSGKGVYEVTLEVAKDAKPGLLDGNVTVYTNDTVKPTITVPIKGLVKLPASASK